MSPALRRWVERVTPARAEIALAGAVVLVGLIGALSTLGRGAWLDEFWTLASSPPGMSGAEFLDVMSREVHPILHYGMAYVAQAAGVTDLAALRAMNLLGVPVALAAIWFARRQGAVTTTQACLVAALYASSALFLDYFAELRAYFLIHSFSVAATLLWVAMARDVEAGRRTGLGVLIAWGLSLAVLVNLHYFATLLGGVMTAALLLAMQLRKRGLRDLIALAAVSAAAASPAVLMALVHASHSDEGIVSWVQTGRIDGAFVILDLVWTALAHNIVAAGCAVPAVLVAVERRALWRDHQPEILLTGVLVVFFGILFVLNVARPIIVDRYLIASSGPALVVVAMLAGGASAPRWAAAAACLFALLTQARNLYAGTYEKEGWRESASLVADLAAACPTTRVYLAPILDLEPSSMLVTVKRFGLRYYADELGFPAEEAGPGDVIVTDGVCPAVVWTEHMLHLGTTRASELLDAAELEWSGAAELIPSGTGAVMLVR